MAIKDVITLAREAGFCHDINNGIYLSAPVHLERFAALVREDEREKQQEPVAWQPIETLKPTTEELDVLMGDGSVLCNVLTQSDGDLWWEGSGTGEKFIDPEYADVTHWRKHSDTTPQTIEAAVLAEREACAKVCIELGTEPIDWKPSQLGVRPDHAKCAAAIRARGE